MTRSNKQYAIGKGDFCKVIAGEFKEEIVVVTGAVEFDDMPPMVIIKLDGGLQTTIERKHLELL